MSCACFSLSIRISPRKPSLSHPSKGWHSNKRVATHPCGQRYMVLVSLPHTNRFGKRSFQKNCARIVLAIIAQVRCTNIFAIHKIRLWSLNFHLTSDFTIPFQVLLTSSANKRLKLVQTVNNSLRKVVNIEHIVGFFLPR